MVMDAAYSAPLRPPTLARLAADLRQAREDFRVTRLAPVVQVDLLSAREALLGAMEAYANALVARRLPVPPQLRDELRLQQGIRRHPDGSWGWRSRD